MDAAERGVAVVDPKEVELRERLAEAAEMIRHTLVTANLDPGIAAAACAELAGENAAVFAVMRDLPPGPLLDETARVMRQRGAAVHQALQPDA